MACTTCGGTTSTPTINYTLPDCPGGEKCEEIQESNCVVYNGPNLGLLGINNNARLKDVLIALHKSMMSLSYNFPAIPYSLWYCYTYSILVNTTQTKTVVEYISQTGNLETSTVSPATTSGAAGISAVQVCALDASPIITSGTGIIIKGIIGATGSNVIGNSTTLTMTSTTNIAANQKVTLYSGTGTLAANTVVSSVVNSTTITINAAPTVALDGAVLVFTTSSSCYAND